MALSKAQQYVLSHLAAAPDKHVIKTWQNEDGTIRRCELDDNDDYKEAELDIISRTTFSALKNKDYIAPARSFADMQCWMITLRGRLTLANEEK